MSLNQSLKSKDNKYSLIRQKAIFDFSSVFMSRKVDSLANNSIFLAEFVEVCR
ncbi:hypothetical protein GCM10007971_06340 [Oceanobacillus indicireducens]|uniref:Uncharacterized protein n=1 Tax=Oceanobacillus indicireducens TaxID=1004261 RepID=A0A918CZJ1_9BACI|nr:hypothetical protein GCM10007971_06340 [Oceanobacillus indicireducens]